MAQAARSRHVLRLEYDRKAPLADASHPLAWDLKFVADLMARLRELEGSSACHEKKVGAIILDDSGRVLAAEANGKYPDGSDCKPPQNRCVHAERRALDRLVQLRAGVPTAIIVSFSPCQDCTGRILSQGLRACVFGSVLSRNPAGILELSKSGVQVCHVYQGRLVQVKTEQTAKHSQTEAVRPASLSSEELELLNTIHYALEHQKEHEATDQELQRLQALAEEDSEGARERHAIAIARLRSQLEWDEICLRGVERGVRYSRLP